MYGILIGILLFICTAAYGQLAIGVGVGVPFGGVSEKNIIPFQKTALVYLDGTISGNYFVDQSGNGRNFLITNKDFSTNWTSGFPYKSAATISAPADDTILIAADVNNFFYAADSTPNQIPVTSLFENIDYANKIFCLHTDQVLDGNGIETSEAKVSTIVVYNTAKTGAALAVCNVFYDVPTENTSHVKWVKKSGNDGTGDGSKSNPWLTLEKADATATAGDTIYVASGQYTENFVADGNLNWFKTGSATVTDVSENQALRINVVGKTHSLNVTGRNVTYGFASYINYADDITINKSRFTHVGAGTSIRYFDDRGIINNSVITSTHGYAIAMNGAAGNFKLLNSLIKVTGGNPLGVLRAGGTLNEVKNCKINASGQTYIILLNDASLAGTFNILGNTINATGGTYGIYDGNNFNATVYLNYNTINYAVPPTSNVILIQKVHTDFEIRNNIINITQSDGVDAVVLVSQSNIDVKNNIMIINGVTNGDHFYRIVATGTPVSSGNLLSNNLCVYTGNLTGLIYSVGSNDVDVNKNKCHNNIISQNYGKGNYSPTVGTHGILYGFSKGIVKHNFIKNCTYGLVSKHDTALGSDILYNVLVDNSIGLYLKGVDSSNVFGNTIISRTALAQTCLQMSSNFDVGSSSVAIKGSIIKNNIMIAESDGVLVFAATASDLDNTTFDYNIYYATDLDSCFRIQNTYYTFAQWQALGYDTHSILLTEEQFNNLFTDYDNDDFSLKTGSAAIGAGEDLGASYNTGLSSATVWSEIAIPAVTTKTQGASWDIGAYIH